MELSNNNPQEAFWSGSFGEDYAQRNRDEGLLASKKAFFSKVCSHLDGVESVLELGANIGLNFIALKNFIPELRATGVEINQSACEEMNKIENVEAIHGSLIDIDLTTTFDLVYTMGVLIHQGPEHLEKIYSKMAQLSKEYVLIAEYYNPSPVEIEYRGHQGYLFKRDFAGEFLDQHSEFSIVDYGFVWHRDPQFPLDDISWFLMRKSK